MRGGRLRPPLVAGILAGVLASLAPAARAADGVVGTWQGHYTCLQGDTALTLTIQEAGSGADVEGLFHFRASAANPGVPEGCFKMSGRHDATTREVSLSAGAWLLRPFGYVSVDLEGRLGPNGDRLRGRVLGPGCTTFEMRRAVPEPGGAAVCRGSATIASE